MAVTPALSGDVKVLSSHLHTLRYLVTIGYQPRGDTMKIAVIGASGNAGSRITAELARRGHAITAIARNPEKIAALQNVTAKAGDVMDQAALTRLLAGHDVATSSVHFLDSDPKKLIAAARDSRLSRYLVVGGAGS